MMIDANLLPFSVDELVKSKAWHDATPEQRRKFISAGVTFDSVLTHYADKYRAKKTIKGEFISCVLWDFYYDLFCNPVENGSFDFELDQVYQVFDGKASIDQYSERLLDEARHPKRWIKRLKEAYRENKAKIIEGATDKNGNIDLDLINDFSVEYRDYLYQRKEILGVWNKMLLFYEGYAIENDYICDLPTMYEIHFNKKRLIKAMKHLGISDWKDFLRNEYTSDDTLEIMSYFDEHGWRYKKILVQFRI